MGNTGAWFKDSIGQSYSLACTHWRILNGDGQTDFSSTSAQPSVLLCVGRDGRPESARRDIINFSFPNPYIIQFVVAGKELLTTLQEQQGYDVDEYKFEGCFIKHKALVDGLRYYDLTLRLYSGELPNDEWLDLCGMIAPKKSIEDLVTDIEEGDVKSSDEIVENLKSLFAQNKYLYSRPQTTDYVEAENKWLDMVRRDAEKEFALGDVEEQQLTDFLAKVK